MHKQPLHVIQHPSGGRHGLPPRPVFGGCRILTTGAARGWRMGPAKILTIGHKKLSASCAPYSFIAHAFEPPECHTCNGLRQQAEQLMGTDRCRGVTAIQCCRTSEVARPKQRCAGPPELRGPAVRRLQPPLQNIDHIHETLRETTSETIRYGNAVTATGI